MATNPNITNYHMQYLDVTSQHWHPGSARFAGGDHLLTAMDNGWKVDICRVIKHWYAGMRSIKIYEFTLVLGNRRMVMPVIDNPYVERFVGESNIKVSSQESISA